MTDKIEFDERGNFVCPYNLKAIIEKIKEVDEKRALSDKFLFENNRAATRIEIGISEQSYGVVMIPVDWILPYLEELRNIKNDR